MFNQEPLEMENSNAFKQLNLFENQEKRDLGLYLEIIRKIEKNPEIKLSRNMSLSTHHSNQFVGNVIRQLKKEGLIKLVGLERNGIQIYGVYKSIESADEELQIPKKSDSQITMTNFYHMYPAFSANKRDAFKKALEKSNINSQVIIGTKERFFEVYSKKELITFYEEFMCKYSKKYNSYKELEEKKPRLELVKTEKVIKKEDRKDVIKKEILSYLSNNENSLISVRLLCLDLYRELRTYNIHITEIESVLRDMYTEEEIRAEKIKVNSKKEAFIQATKSLTWKEFEKNGFDSDTYMSVPIFFQYHISKKYLNKNQAEIKIAKSNLFSIKFVARNRRRVTLYLKEDLFEMFKRNLVQEREKRQVQTSDKKELVSSLFKDNNSINVEKQIPAHQKITKLKETKKTLFKFKIFGKEVSLTIG